MTVAPQASDPGKVEGEKPVNPLNLSGPDKSWLEDFIITTLPTNSAFQVLAQKMAYPVGFPRLIMEDLTANTSEYVWTDPVTGLGYLYCNGAAVSQTTYADLYAQWGASKWAADSGGNFYLPDTRGRSLFLCGTNSATDLGDNDGVTESSRQPKHTHTVTIATASAGTPAGTVSITDPGHAHTVSIGANSGGGTRVKDDNAAETRTQATSSNTTGISATFSGSALSSHGHSGSTAGSGMSGSDAVAHIVIGSLVVRF